MRARTSAREQGARRTVVASLILALLASGTATAEMWRGLAVAPEHRCAPYNRVRDYPYSQSVERAVARRLGAIRSPYTGRCFASLGETDIEHIVATSEAHDSGLCAADATMRKKFASDLRNLTLASPQVNRHEKRGHDAAGWLPTRNRCWFAARVIEVKRAYGLSVDGAERDALEAVLSQCADTRLRLGACAAPAAASATPSTSATGDALERYDDNGNGRITCAEARRHHIAPVRRGHPAYPFMRDGDGDGIVCE